MSNENFLLLGTILLVIVILGLLGFAVFHQNRIFLLEEEKAAHEKMYETKLSEAVIASQENERKQIGEDLHDEISPFLLSAKRNIEAFWKDTTDEEKYKKHIQKVQEGVETSISMLKALSHNFHPAELENSGFLYSLQDFCAFMEDSWECQISIHTTLEEVSLEPSTQMMLLRIVKELILNAIRHGNASQFKISIFEESNFFNLIIFHNGNMFLKKDYLKGLQSQNGLGLKNIQKRLDLLKGEIIFYSNKDLTEQSVQIQFQMS